MSSYNDLFGLEDYVQRWMIKKHISNLHIHFVLNAYEDFTEYSCHLEVPGLKNVTVHDIVRLYRILSLLVFRKFSSDTSVHFMRPYILQDGNIQRHHHGNLINISFDCVFCS
jgi:hypothetical protein